MVLDAYETLLKGIGDRLDTETELKPDENNTCLIRMVNGVRLQVELDREGKHLLIGTELGIIPVGGYREDLFRTALITNGTIYPRYGILAYSRQSKQLVLFERRSLKYTSAEEIVDILDPFSEKAALWSNAIANSEIPALPAITSAPSGGGIFGLA